MGMHWKCLHILRSLQETQNSAADCSLPVLWRPRRPRRRTSCAMGSTRFFIRKLMYLCESCFREYGNINFRLLTFDFPPRSTCPPSRCICETHFLLARAMYPRTCLSTRAAGRMNFYCNSLSTLVFPRIYHAAWLRLLSSDLRFASQRGACRACLYPFGISMCECVWSLPERDENLAEYL